MSSAALMALYRMLLLRPMKYSQPSPVPAMGCSVGGGSNAASRRMRSAVMPCTIALPAHPMTKPTLPYCAAFRQKQPTLCASENLQTVAPHEEGT